MNFDDLPKGIAGGKLLRKELAADPFDQLTRWLENAKKAGVAELNAMALATAAPSGKPSCRMVLLKGFDHRGLVFYTNYQSRKSREIDNNPFAMATLFWKEQARQVCVEGRVEKTTREESAAYFAKRPRGSQVGAWASMQDQVLPSRDVLEANFERIEKQYENMGIPLPPHWGGFRIIPERFEFWQGGEYRVHDRFQYVQEQGAWKIERLAP